MGLDILLSLVLVPILRLLVHRVLLVWVVEETAYLVDGKIVTDFLLVPLWMKVNLLISLHRDGKEIVVLVLCVFTPSVALLAHLNLLLTLLTLLTSLLTSLALSLAPLMSQAMSLEPRKRSAIFRYS